MGTHEAVSVRQDSCDVAVIGAGPAGAATARLLAGAGLRVTLLERSGIDAPRVGESLSPGVQPLLKTLGVWDAFEALRPLPSFGTQSFWGSDSTQSHSHLATPYGCGWHVDRQAFDRMLADAAAQAGARLRTGCRVLSCRADQSRSGGWVVHGCHEASGMQSMLRARVLIDATGRTGVLKRMLGARRVVFDRLVAVAAQMSDPRAADRCFTLVEAVPNGWWYSAPTPGGRQMAMLMTDGDLLNPHRLDASQHWRDALAQTRGTRACLPDAPDTPLCWGPKIVAAMSQRQLRRDLQAPWLSVGDAALAVDPVSGSGVIRALRTARDAAETVAAMLAGNLVGNAQAIAAYEARRDAECTQYLIERGGVYALEQRWPDADFWRRRQAVAPAPAAVPAQQAATAAAAY